MKSFNIYSEEYYFKVEVHTTKDSMYSSVEKHHTSAGKKIPERDYDALSSPYNIICFPGDDNGYPARDKNIGILFLHEKALGVGVVSHECLHVAMQHERLINHNVDGVLGDDCGRSEERVAHHLTEYVIELVNNLYENNCYKVSRECK